MDKNKKISKKYNLKVIEDAYKTIGLAQYNGNNTGRLSDIVTNSFYASHIIKDLGQEELFALMIISFIKKQSCSEVGKIFCNI